LLQEIFANAPVGLQIYARDGHCVLVNQAHTQLFGAVPPPEFNLFTDNILVERGVAELVRRGFAGERIVIPPIWYDIRELRNVPPDMVLGGRRIAIGAQLVPLRDTQGEVTHVLVVFHDVTQLHEARERAEAVAAEAERRAAYSTFLAEAGRVLAASLDFEETLARVARLATQALADFCIVDLVAEDGSYRRVAVSHADPAHEPLLDELTRRFPPHRGSPQPGCRAIECGAQELVTEADAAIIGTRTRSAEHLSLIQKLGVRSFMAVPLQLGERTLGAITLAYVGERRYSTADVPLVEALASRAAVAIENARLYRAAEAARAEAEAANRAKDEFLAMLGHELRNPLAPIVTALELTAKRDGESRERKIIERQVHQLHRLVDDLLDASRIRRGTVELDRRIIDIVDAVNDGIEVARPLVDQREHHLELALERGTAVLGDRVRIAQLVSNLVTNAARYTEPGGTITVTLEPRDATVVLRVRDTGVGIPPELLPHIFEVFSRGNRSIDRAAGGLGVGLAIVRSLAELHGGHVTAHSDGPGSGSELAVSFPVAAEPPSRPTPVPVPPRSRRRAGYLLIVDDNTDAAHLTGEALEHHGFECVVVDDPIRALNVARDRAPAVALVDIGLPTIDGYELARRLHALPGLEHLPIVALSGHGQPSDRNRSLAAGFVQHLVKPVQIATIVRVLEPLFVDASGV
jgi:signal transduction histidine kinase/CheY-like chemotaxis protein